MSKIIFTDPESARSSANTTFTYSKWDGSLKFIAVNNDTSSKVTVMLDAKRARELAMIFIKGSRMIVKLDSITGSGKFFRVEIKEGKRNLKLCIDDGFKKEIAFRIGILKSDLEFLGKLIQNELK